MPLHPRAHRVRRGRIPPRLRRVSSPSSRLVVTNIFRDQLDRYGEVTHTLDRHTRGPDAARPRRDAVPERGLLADRLARARTRRTRSSASSAWTSASVGEAARGCRTRPAASSARRGVRIRLPHLRPPRRLPLPEVRLPPHRPPRSRSHRSFRPARTPRTSCSIFSDTLTRFMSTCRAATTSITPRLPLAAAHVVGIDEKTTVSALGQFEMRLRPRSSSVWDRRRRA